jgi:endonuclease G
VLFVRVAASLAVLSTFAVLQAISIPAAPNPPYTQNFDGIGSLAAATLPADFRVDKPGTVRTVGTWTGAGTATTLVGGANLSTTASNGIYNFGSGSTSTGGTDRAVGFLSSGTATQSGNLYAQLTNNTGGAIGSLQISYDVEKYRQGTNAAGFRIQLFYSTDGTAWTSAGSNFLTSFSGDSGANSGYANAPGVTVSVNNALTQQVVNGGTLYLAWNYSVASGSTTTNAQALAIDNISIVGVSAPQTNPTGVGSAAPGSVAAGDTTLLTVTVTPGDNPPSSGITVTGDLQSITAGASAVAFSGSGNTFTYLATIDTTAASGPKSLPITVSDAQGRSSNVTLPLTVISNSPVVISQIYGGGGNSNATYQNDYVQLYNRTDAPVDISGWTLQYASSTGTSWTNKQPLGGPIAPHQYYLVALASGGAVGAALPPANISGFINMSATTGKIALVDGGDSLIGGCPTDNPHVKDFVGYGTGASCHEGGANAPAPSNTTALFRRDGGATDTDQNGSDFTAGAPAPISTTPIVEIGPLVLATDPTLSGINAPRDATIEVQFTEPVDVFGQWFDINCAVTGPHNDATTSVNGTSHFITPNVNFQAGEQCAVRIFKDQVSDVDTDDSAPNTDHLPADYVWSFTVATGAAPPYTPDVHLTMGNPSGAVADVNQPNNYLMMKPEYALSYNRALGRPNWVSWHLTPEWFGTLARVDTFRADPQVLPDWYRVQSFDFENSGFDRGHMTPNADRDLETSIPINQATYLMSNMLAQAPDNNQGPWANLENHLRDLVGSDRANPLAEAYIVSGPAGAGGSGSNGGTTVTLANGNVTVPAYTWKVALIIPFGTNDVARVACDTAHTIAVIMPNTQGIRTNNADDWRTFLTTVDAVETLTGYDFFSSVPPAIQNCIQAGIDGDNPQSQTITFAPIAAHQYGDADFAVSATASSNLPVTFSVVSGPATVVGGVVHLTGAGVVTIRASQTGTLNPQPPLKNTFAKAAPVDQTFTVAKGTPSFTGLSSPTTEAGSSTTVEGVLGVGGLVPSGSVGITAGTLNVMAPIDANGHFTATLATASFSPAASPFAIGFSYAGDANFSDTTATSTLTVADTIPPVVTLLGPALLTVEAGTAFVDPGATAQDSFAGDLTAAIHASGAVDTSLVGTYTRTYTVSDGYNTGSATRTVKVVDTTAPSISDVTATPNLVTEPNHKMFAVLVAYSTSDVSGGPVCSLKVTSNEPVNGTGDGNTAVDWLVVDVHHVQLRAERAGTGSGRIYTIAVSCADAFGNTASKQTRVAVPK